MPVLGREDVLRFDHGRKTYALCRDAAGELFATDGICTHGNTHLADGLVKGRHDRMPQAQRPLPPGRRLARPRAGLPRAMHVSRRKRGGRLFLNRLAGRRAAGPHARRRCICASSSNRNVATFIKEIVLEPVEPAGKIDFTPGDYLQFDIPAYDCIRFRDFDIPQPYAAVWEAQHVFDLVARNPRGRPPQQLLAGLQSADAKRSSASMSASPRPRRDRTVRPASAPPTCSASKPGDMVTAVGPFGDFHIKPTQKEMVYIGGGSGMAPLRAHLSHLFETANTARRVSFWYGARSRQEIFYQDYFDGPGGASSPTSASTSRSPRRCRRTTGPAIGGLIHEVVLEQYLQRHENPAGRGVLSLRAAADDQGLHRRCSQASTSMPAISRSTSSNTPLSGRVAGSGR